MQSVNAPLGVLHESLPNSMPTYVRMDPTQHKMPDAWENIPRFYCKDYTNMYCMCAGKWVEQNNVNKDVFAQFASKYLALSCFWRPGLYPANKGFIKMMKMYCDIVMQTLPLV